MEYLHIVNWNRFQLYKKDSPNPPPWIKLYRDILSDFKFSELPDTAKWHVVGLFLLAARCKNHIPYEPRWIAKEIDAKAHIDFAKIFSTGFVQRVYEDGTPIREEEIRLDKNREEQNTVRVEGESSPPSAGAAVEGAKREEAAEGQGEPALGGLPMPRMAAPADEASFLAPGAGWPQGAPPPKPIIPMGPPPPPAAKNDFDDKSRYDDFWNMCDYEGRPGWRGNYEEGWELWRKNLSAGAKIVDLLDAGRKYVAHVKSSQFEYRFYVSINKFLDPDKPRWRDCLERGGATITPYKAELAPGVVKGGPA